jgi:hypothetical protein
LLCVTEDEAEVVERDERREPEEGSRAKEEDEEAPWRMEPSAVREGGAEAR